MGLEEEIAELAKKHGWSVELRRKHGRRIQDLILERRGLVLVVQAKDLSSPAGPKAVSQARQDYQEYLMNLVKRRLGLLIVPVLVSKSFSQKAKRRASSYHVRCYKLDELEKLLM
jgi:HJR/Mrr/RecB family endonuclease